MKLGDQSEQRMHRILFVWISSSLLLVVLCAFYDFIYRRTEEYLPTTTAEFADAWMACGKRDGNSIQKYETLNIVLFIMRESSTSPTTKYYYVSKQL